MRDGRLYEKTIMAIYAEKRINAEDDDVAAFLYAHCISACSGSVSIDGAEYNARALTFEQFLDLPQVFTNIWIKKVFDKNPDFTKIPESEELTASGDAEKKSE